MKLHLDKRPVAPKTGQTDAARSAWIAPLPDAPGDVPYARLLAEAEAALRIESQPASARPVAAWWGQERGA